MSRITAFLIYSLVALTTGLRVRAECTANTTDTAGLQDLLTNGGEGYVLSLCEGQVYAITQSLNFTKANQEISTENYPTSTTRALLIVSGSNSSTTSTSSHTTAIRGDCETCSGVKIRNIQIDGNRGENPIFTGGGNIEIGGANQNQIVDRVRSFDPRGWSCLHVAEGPFSCLNVTISNNDIGPCGSDYFQYWSDGVSLSCANSLVENNNITDATDGGIVIFGSPGSTIRNNNIAVTDRVMLGGINMVDYSPWQGNYSNLLVEGNNIFGGFADSYGNATTGIKNTSAIIKVGMGIGPLVWWGDERYGTKASSGPATIANNVLSGSMVFGIAIAGAESFTLENNTLMGNTSFAGKYAVNCTTGADTPHPPTAFLIDRSFNTTNVTLDDVSSFENGTAPGLTCFSVMDAPPLDEYPYGPDFDWAALAGSSGDPSASSSITGGSSGTGSAGQPAQSSQGAGIALVADTNKLIVTGFSIAAILIGSTTLL